MDVAPEILASLRSLCLALPEVVEQEAWVGIRWRIRGRTFAHVLLIDSGWPPAYATAAATAGPATVLMFRSSGPELDALRQRRPPVLRAGVARPTRSAWSSTVRWTGVRSAS